MGDPNPGGTGGRGGHGGHGGTGGSGSRGKTGATGATGEAGKEGPRGRTPLATKGAYIILAAAAIVGVWAMTEHAQNEVIDNINKTVSALCVTNIPTIQKENDLRDVQIEVVQDTKRINLRNGEADKAALNDTLIKAYRSAKRHVPTEQECKQKLIK